MNLNDYNINKINNLILDNKLSYDDVKKYKEIYGNDLIIDYFEPNYNNPSKTYIENLVKIIWKKCNIEMRLMGFK